MTCCGCCPTWLSTPKADPVYVRLNPDLGWKWRDENGQMKPFYLAKLSQNAGMISGRIIHSGIFASRPIQDFDLMSLDGYSWFPLHAGIALIPRERPHELQKSVVPVQVVYLMDDQKVL